MPLKPLLNLMIKHIHFLFLFFFASVCASAQTIEPVAAKDSVLFKEKTTAGVTVYAFAQHNTILYTAAAVSLLNKNDLQRNGASSFVTAMNTVAGIRTDERSPGSYRISIRGNLLRSTFGVRNVKVYLNGLPYTDASGNTYFNELALNSIDNMEIIKGPGGSMYGAGTGGVILLNNDPAQKNSTVQITGGSYGSLSASGKYYTGNKKIKQSLSFSHDRSDGYRNQSAMRRDAAGYTLTASLGKRNIITGNILYSNLFYKTPGGLTQAQLLSNPRQARPSTALFPGAAEQQAALYLSTIYTGISDGINLGGKWKNTTGIYFSYTGFRNPTIRNYEQKNEKSTGGRTVFEFSSGKYSVATGAEYQYSYINTSVSDNDHGTKTLLQYHDKIPVHQLNLFAQAAVLLPLRSQLTAGISYNDFYYGFNRVSIPMLKDNSGFSPQYIPRISLQKKAGKNSAVYFSYSKGYSPPTIDEIHASDGIFNKVLHAEDGSNYEAGIKTQLLKNRLYADLSGYIFHLQHSIVSRRDATGADYYVNAGKTNQEGLEFSLSWNAIEKETGFVSNFKLRSSATYVHARFADYQQETVKYSGNLLTGTSPFIFFALADLRTGPGFYTNVTYTYTDKIPLNDANTFFAKAYNIACIKLGWQTDLSSAVSLDLFGSIQKGFNKNYSLGNDLNADANRFFNPAAPQIFTGGIALKFK